jgi:hypothetical protein
VGAQLGAVLDRQGGEVEVAGQVAGGAERLQQVAQDPGGSLGGVDDGGSGGKLVT